MTIATAQIIASSLLVYPDDEYLARRDEFWSLAERLDPAWGQPLIDFFFATKNKPIEEMQTHYVEIFDMRRRCSLFLTSWTHGDTRNRGMAIVHFKNVYKESGILMPDSELPDHLAVVLEYAALIDPVEGNLLLGEHRAPIELIRDALRACESPYRHVLDSIVATLPAMTPEIEARARALALSGPPQEFVGLSGAVSVALQPFTTSVTNGVRI